MRVLAAILASVLWCPAQSWTPLTNHAPDLIATCLLLRDARVMCHSENTGQWDLLTPDATGGYQNGTWKRATPMPDGYAPQDFSSAVLPDGRVIVEGGEFNNQEKVWTNLGAIYDPTLNLWQPVASPEGWITIGDAASAVLSDGTYMQANCCTSQTALLDAHSLTWTPGPRTLVQNNNEEGWTLLPSGQVLMVDSEVNHNCPGNSSEVYDGTQWQCGPTLPQQLWGVDGELGATVLTYAGTVLQFGGLVNATAILNLGTEGQNNGDEDGYDTRALAGIRAMPALQSAVGYGGMGERTDGILPVLSQSDSGSGYHSKVGQWSVGPPLPLPYLTQDDGPAALEPNGKVLAVVGARNSPGGCRFVEYDPNVNAIKETAEPPECPSYSINSLRLLVLPTGEVLSSHFDRFTELYTPSSGVASGTAPAIAALLPSLVAGSSNNVLYGRQLNGLSQVNFFGDDVQSASNYPLVRLSNGTQVWWARTHDDSYSGIGPGVLSYTRFDLPQMPAGAYWLEVVTNGISSNVVQVSVQEAR